MYTLFVVLNTLTTTPNRHRWWGELVLRSVTCHIGAPGVACHQHSASEAFWCYTQYKFTFYLLTYLSTWCTGGWGNAVWRWCSGPACLRAVAMPTAAAAAECERGLPSTVHTGRSRWVDTYFAVRVCRTACAGGAAVVQSWTHCTARRRHAGIPRHHSDAQWH